MLTTLLERRATQVDPVHPRDPALARLFGFGSETRSKIPVDEETGMRFSAVYAAIRIIAETIGSLPIKVFEKKRGGGRAEVLFHPVTQLLMVEPNADMIPMVYRELVQSWTLAWGNDYTEILWSNRGEPLELIPRHPALVSPFRDRKTNRIHYRVVVDGETRMLDRSQVLHVPGLGGDGIIGWSPIRLFAEAIGMGLAAERLPAR